MEFGLTWQLSQHSIKIGKVPSGITGLTSNGLSCWLNWKALRKSQPTGESVHKEESMGRIKADSQDKKRICNTLSLEKCIHPLDVISHMQYPR